MLQPITATHSSPMSYSAAGATRVNARLPNGALVVTAARAGQSVATALVASGTPLRHHEAAGTCPCGRCHVRVAASWLGKLPPPGDEERALLAQLPGAGQSSRLACAIELTPELDGLMVEVANDSLEPQTYWAAG